MIPSVGYAKVKYVTEHQENDRPMSLEYSKFLNFLFTNFTIKDKELLLKNLNEHQIIFLDNETGQHYVKSLYEDAFKADYKTLIKLNNKPEEKPIPNTIIETFKKSLDNFKNPFANDRRNNNK